MLWNRRVRARKLVQKIMRVRYLILSAMADLEDR